MTFTETMFRWYEEWQRTLPWRGERDPYKIWVSEVILQQTRVAQGWDYYHRFVAQFPTVEALANAPEEQVLKLWQGLGYYSRARNLHFAAKTVMLQHQGIFPNRYEEIRELKGIGNYTAAAIASMAFDLPYPAVDGNVLRVICRFTGITDNINAPATVKHVTEICNRWIDRKQPGIFNQALMDFGSLVCTPKSPDCENCPLQNACYAHTHGLAAQIPVKINRIKIKERFFTYLFFVKGKKTIVQQRIGKDIWKNLYELPLWETQSALSQEQVQQLVRTQYSAASCKWLWSTATKLTHQLIHAEFYLIEPATLPQPESYQKIIDIEELSQLPVSRIMQKFFLAY
ncbi:MAG: A/G-specific adenine glycosylase [Bacteroidales bacterium]|jgi:A/G-specific adenine glycosylase|nr:A/G-specific adenine glycosylase [Bacteroidales bacterium]